MMPDNLPDDSLIVSAFEQAGYTVERDAKGRYCDGMWKLMGSDPNVACLLRDESIIDLFSNAQIRKGKAFTYREMLGITQPSSDERITHFYEQLMLLAEHDILLRGYNVKCPFCDLDTWYDPGSIAAGICLGCRSPLRLPLELPFAFRLNQLFMEGLKQGALTVLLAALMLIESTHGDIIWRSGYAAHKPGLSSDIDLAAFTGSGLILAECKDNFPDTRPDIGAIVAQLESSLTVARDIGAAQFLFVTLRDNVPEAITSFLHNAANARHTPEIRFISRRGLLS
jgi:hypothetical protein